MIEPIIDLRGSIPRHRRLPTDLGTLALWTLGGALCRHLLSGVLLGSGGVPLILLGVAGMVSVWRPVTPKTTTGGNEPGAAQPVRKTLAEQFALKEEALFRAQHAPVCLVDHDPDGRIVSLVCRDRPTIHGHAGGCSPAVSALAVSPCRDRHAHSVG